MRTLLVFPPQWLCQQPHYAISLLAGQLRHHHCQVEILDLNLEIFETLLEHSYLMRTKAKVILDHQRLTMETMLRLAVDDASRNLQRASEHFLASEAFLRKYQPTWEALGRDIDRHREALRDPERYYNPYQLIRAFQGLDEALELASLPFFPSRLRWNDFSNCYCPLRVDEILEYCRSDELNMFRRLYLPYLERLERDPPDLVAVSINAFSQVLPGLTFAAMARERSEGRWHVNVGGNFFTRLKEPLLRRPDFIRAVAHSFTLGEGEASIVQLTRTVARDRPLDEVPGVIHLDPSTGEARATPQIRPPRLDGQAWQDFSGFQLDRYLAPERVICIRATKGCYWGKCTFCDSDYGMHRDARSIDDLVAEIRHLRDTWGIRHYEFVDECIPPDYLLRMARRFIAEDLDIHWFCNARTERAYTPELLRTLKQSGLTMLLWGIESGSPRIMRLINKGVQIENRLDLLRAAADLGIWNFAYIFFGFPTETEEEAMSTIRLICDHPDVIHSYGRSIFTLGKHSPLKHRARELGILEIIKDDQEFSTNLYYRTSKGLDDQGVQRIVKRCTTLCREAYGEPLWMYLRSRENLHLYLAHHGLPFVRDFQFREEEACLAGELW
jgi:hypothetical protein